MTNRTLIALISMIAVLGLVAIGALDSNAHGASVTAQQQPAGCLLCHGIGNTKPLLKEVPTGHFEPNSAGPSDLNYCLKCHTQAASAPAFGWTVHQSHFATHIAAKGQTATCTLCHQLDASGNFTLTGATNSPSFKTTAEVVAKMPTYYLSRARSTRLDHTHGEQSVTCASCHEVAFPTQAPKKEQCLTCHGTYERLAEASPFHFDTLYPHFGTGGPVECSACHKAHKKSVLACDECHGFGIPVP